MERDGGGNFVEDESPHYGGPHGSCAREGAAELRSLKYAKLAGEMEIVMEILVQKRMDS